MTGGLIVEFQDKIVGMLLSLFQIKVLPPTDGWIQSATDSCLYNILVKIFMESADYASVDYQLFCHQTVQLIIALYPVTDIKTTLVTNGFVPKITALLAQEKVSPKILHLKADSDVINSHLFIACLDFCGQLFKHACSELTDQNFSMQTDQFFMTVTPIINNIFQAAIIPGHKSLTQLCCIQASVNFVSSVDWNTLPFLAYNHWETFSASLSPLLNFMVYALCIPGFFDKSFLSQPQLR